MTSKKRIVGQRLHQQGYAVLLASTMDGAKNAYDLQAATGVKYESAHRVMLRLHASGLVHIEAWSQPMGRGAYVPSYRFGQGADAPYPGEFHKAPRLNDPRTRTLDLLSFCDWLLLLREKPHTVIDLSGRSGNSLSRFRLLLHKCHALKLVHVCEWIPREDHPGPPTVVYAFGPGVDVPRPKRIPTRIVAAASRERVKARKVTEGTIRLALSGAAANSVFALGMAA